MIYINSQKLICREIYPFLGNNAFKNKKIKLYNTFYIITYMRVERIHKPINIEMKKATY